VTRQEALSHGVHHVTLTGDDVTGSGDEGGVAVEEDVDKEDDVDDAVGGQLPDVVDGLAAERRVVRHHHRRVVRQHQDQPVPLSSSRWISQSQGKPVHQDQPVPVCRAGQLSLASIRSRQIEYRL